MLICPDCGAENIDGVDSCDVCSQSLTDLSRRMPSSTVEAGLLQDLVSQIPVHPPVTVSPAATVGEVLATMDQGRIGCVLIVDENSPDQLAGIFTERDALMRLNVEAPGRLEQPIEKFMTSNPATIPADAKIAFALHKMNVGGYRHLPLLDEGRPVSVISVRDLLRYLTERAGLSA